MRDLPPTPEALLEKLFEIFPQLRTDYQPIHDDTPTFHSVLIAFTGFFGAHSSTFSERQLRAFGDLVSAAVAAGGVLANAFETCLLEHLHQIRAWQVLRPHLSELARERSHANKSLQATRDGRSSSASRFTPVGPACLSSGRSASSR